MKIRSIRKMVDNRGIKILVYGPAGAGKTVLAGTTGESTLVLSAEAGLLSLRDAPDYIKGVEITSIQDLREILAWLIEDAASEDGPKFKWIALDSITEIAEQVLSFEKSGEKDPRKAYMTMQDEIMKILRGYRDLIGYDVYMSCKQERVDDDGKKLYMPMMPGTKLAQQIPYLFDEVFALRVEKDEDGEYRVLQTSRDAKYEAKDRSGALKDFEKPSLKAIKKKILQKAEDANKPKPPVEEKSEESESEGSEASEVVEAQPESNVVEVEIDE
jgi:hypothetical protein